MESDSCFLYFDNVGVHTRGQCSFDDVLLAVVCYLVSALSPISVIGLFACALCGLAVGIMWPGTISISAEKCPRGGTAMFAFLALAGDL